MEGGFSLLEILVAVVIMGLAYVAILQNFSQSARNIHLMGETRASLLENALLFEKILLSLDQADAGDAGESETLVEGSRYQLNLVEDENSDFEILRLEKK